MSDLRSALFIPLARQDTAKWQQACLDHVDLVPSCTVAALIDTARGWTPVQQLLDAHLIDLVIVALREHLPLDPWIEVATERMPVATSSLRRAQTIRRTAGGSP